MAKDLDDTRPGFVPVTINRSAVDREDGEVILRVAIETLRKGQVPQKTPLVLSPALSPTEIAKLDVPEEFRHLIQQIRAAGEGALTCHRVIRPDGE